MPFVANLPMRKSDNPKHGPRTARFDSCFDGTCHGTLTVESPGKKADRYAVTRFRCDFAGQGYRCVKVAGGTDAEADGYDVFLSDRGDRDTCECRGFLRHGIPCKHIDGLRAVIDLGALHLPGFDDADEFPVDWEWDRAADDQYAAYCDEREAAMAESVYQDAWGNLIATGYATADRW